MGAKPGARSWHSSLETGWRFRGSHSKGEPFACERAAFVTECNRDLSTVKNQTNLSNRNKEMYPRDQLWNNRYRKAQNAPAVMVARAASNRSAFHFRVGAP